MGDMVEGTVTGAVGGNMRSKVLSQVKVVIDSCSFEDKVHRSLVPASGFDADNCTMGAFSRVAHFVLLASWHVHAIGCLI